MKIYYTLILVLMAGSAYGQSNLPPCRGSDVSRWSNCTGLQTTKDFIYKGEFLNGKMHGSGQMNVLQPDFKGDKYVGEFKDGKYSGQGTYTFANGNKYVGENKDGKRDGQGTYTFADGRIHVGEWVESKPSGRFIKYRADKTVEHSGIYKDNVLVTSQYIDPNSFTRIALGDITKNISDNRQSDNSITFDGAKLKCEELGFKPETEDFGKCVLQLTK